MITEKCHNRKHIKKYIEQAYAADPALIAQWHITSGDTLDNCVNRTVADLEESKDLQFFNVFEYGQFIGYFGLELNGSFMPTVYIIPKYRKTHKEAFWKLIEHKVKELSGKSTWRAAIYTKNTPCMKFYRKQGKELHRSIVPSSNNAEAAIFEFQGVS